MHQSLRLRLIGISCALAGISVATAMLTPNDAQGAQPPCDCVSSHPFRVIVPALARNEPLGPAPALDGCSAVENEYQQVLLAKSEWLATDLIDFSNASDAFTKNPSATNGNRVWWTASFVAGTANELNQLAPPPGSPWGAFDVVIDPGWSAVVAAMALQQQWATTGDKAFKTQGENRFLLALPSFVAAGLVAPQCPGMPGFSLPGLP